MTSTTTQPLSRHLTEEHFTDCVLNGCVPSDCREHLARCQQCRQELETFESSVRSFNSASLVWSKARPASSLRATAGLSRRGSLFVPAGWALGAALLLVAGLPTLRHPHVPAAVHTQAHGTAPLADTDAEVDAEIAQDNHLLRSVQLALAPVEPSPLDEYNLNDAGSSRRQFQQQPRFR